MKTKSVEEILVEVSKGDDVGPISSDGLYFDWELTREDLRSVQENGGKTSFLANTKGELRIITLRHLYIFYFFRALKARVSGLLDDLTRKFYPSTSRLNSSYTKFLNVILNFSEFFWTLKSKRFLAGVSKDVVYRQGRIVLAIPNLSVGGTPRQLLYTAKGLRAQGYDAVDILCFKTHVNGDTLGDCPARQLDEGKYSDRTLMLNLMWRSSDFVENLPEELRNRFIRFYDQFEENTPEVVHCWLDPVSLSAGLAALAAGVPKIVLSFRSMAPYRHSLLPRWWRHYFRVLSSHPNVRLCANSEAGARDYEQWLGLSQGTIAVIYNGIDLGLFTQVDSFDSQAVREQLGIQLKHQVVGTLFRLDRLKNPILWLETAKYVYDRKPSTRFMIVGFGEMYELMQKRIQELGLNGIVHIVDKSINITAVMDSFDLFLLTSRIEGMPNVLLEAQACGIPVVSTVAGGAGETFSPEETGLLSQEGTAKDLGEKVLRILEDESFLFRTKSLGPKFIEKNFSQEKMINRTLDLYFK